jgi:hypothetical protein
VTLKIEKIVRKRRTTVRLIGRVQAEDLPEVERQLEVSGPRFVLQLDEVTLVDVHAVRFLNTCKRVACGSSTAHHTYASGWSESGTQAKNSETEDW